MNIGKIIKIYRAVNDISLRVLANDIGINAATLMRLENGDTPNGETLSKVLIWLLK